MVDLPSSGTLYPVLPLRDIVVFPHMIVPLFVGRDKSVRALEDVMREDKQILLVSQKNAAQDEPGPADVYSVGTLGTVLQLLKLPDGTVKVLVEGQQRARLVRFSENEEFYQAYAEPLEEEDENAKDEEDQQETDALMRAVVSQFEQYIKLNKKIPPEVLVSLGQIDSPSKLADTVASHLSLKLPDKQELLEAETVSSRLEKVYSHMESEIGVLQVEKRIRNRVKRQMEKTQREYYLNEQMKAIQKELGEGEDGKDELTEISEKIKKVKLSKEAREKAEAELKKLRHMSPMSAEASVVRNYLDWILGIPWKKNTKLKHDVNFAEGVLNEDHFGLEKVKERILEYLAVQQRVKKVKGPILCLVGPPGVGKTSLGRSIARATGREFVRMSLGGVRDEAEIRGHRRTYIGSMPGKVVQGMKKAKASNPLFLFDEIDKLGSDWRGDPSSALLEVLDPEQNNTFNDHYLEVDYDLSDTLFICTANSLNMPQPLLDRMEIIRLSGYTEDEKVEIARRHLISKQVKDNGLKEDEFEITEEALRGIVRYYTREAGVRSLERNLAKLERKAVKELLTAQSDNAAGAAGSKTEKDGKKKSSSAAKGGEGADQSAKTDQRSESATTEVQSDSDGKVLITLDSLSKYLGVRKYRYGELEENDLVGVTTGLAWTEVGGDILQIEAVALTGRGKVSATGKLGDVMKESVQAAESFVKSRAPSYGIKPSFFRRRDIHVHVPEGATPKDGPSAGVAMVTSIVSVMTGIPIRRDVGMTGEISLRGRVLPIGGLKEKLLAALRAGITTVLIPKDNEKDLAEIPDNVKEELEIIPVTMADEVLAHALSRPLAPIQWSEEEELAELARERRNVGGEDGGSDEVRPH